jgi:hypothetical protein
MAVELAVLPLGVVLIARRRFLPLLLAAIGLASIAEAGRRRAGGASRFPASSSLLAPVWVAERAVCSWLAVWARIDQGGVRYAGTVLAKSASSPRQLRRRLAGRAPSAARSGPRPAAQPVVGGEPVVATGAGSTKARGSASSR